MFDYCLVCQGEDPCKTKWFVHTCKKCGEINYHMIALTNEVTGDELGEGVGETMEEAINDLNICHEHKIELLKNIPEAEDLLSHLVASQTNKPTEEES